MNLRTPWANEGPAMPGEAVRSQKAKGHKTGRVAQDTLLEIPRAGSSADLPCLLCQRRHPMVLPSPFLGPGAIKGRWKGPRQQ